MVRLGTWTPVVVSNSRHASPLLIFEANSASLILTPREYLRLFTFRFQEGSRHLAVAQPDDLLGFEPDLAQACDEALGVGASPPMGGASAVLGAAQLLNECLLSPLDEVYEVSS